MGPGLDHAANKTEALARAFRVLECESTPAEIAPHLTREDVGILRDLADWARDVIAARPPIQPAREWASPTQLRKEVAARTGAAREFVGRPRRRRKPFPGNTADWLKS